MLLLFRVLYYTLTLKEKIMKINYKFKIKSNGNTILKVIDDDKIEYTIEEDIMISKKMSSDLWNKLSEGVTYKVKYYGLNILSLNLNYKIVAIESFTL